VQGLGHCGACHTPRGWAFQEKGLDESSSAYLSGAPLDHWTASSLNGDINSGLGRMTEEDIFEFLKTGKNKFGTAFGTMVEVVNNSTAFMTDDDLHAIATYLKSLPAQKEKNEAPYMYDGASAEALANLKFDDPGSATYYQFCVSCHQYDGSGQNMYMPALAGNPVVLDDDASSLVNVILNGSLRVVSEGRPEHYDMPYFRVLLDDTDIANVTNYIRKAWGNNGMGEVTAADVATIRMETDPTRNDDAFVLRMK
jgi:mono/diheme cytochrome c family protein